MAEHQGVIGFQFRFYTAIAVRDMTSTKRPYYQRVKLGCNGRGCLLRQWSSSNCAASLPHNGNLCAFRIEESCSFGACAGSGTSSLRQGRSWLTLGERRRVKGFNDPTTRRQFSVGRSVLRMILAKLLNCDPGAVPLSTTADDHVLVPVPNENRTVMFDVSHVGIWVVIAASAGRVGIGLVNSDGPPSSQLGVVHDGLQVQARNSAEVERVAHTTMYRMIDLAHRRSGITSICPCRAPYEAQSLSTNRFNA